MTIKHTYKGSWFVYEYTTRNRYLIGYTTLDWNLNKQENVYKPEFTKDCKCLFDAYCLIDEEIEKADAQIWSDPMSRN